MRLQIINSTYYTKLAAAAGAQVQQKMKYKEEVRVPAATAKTIAFKKTHDANLA